MPPAHVTVSIPFQKLVTCEHCGCRYRLGKSSNFTGQGASEDEARHRAQAAAESSSTFDEPAPGPCPNCSRFPQESGPKKRLARLTITFCLVVVSFSLVVAEAVRALSDPIDVEVWGWAAAGIALIVTVANVVNLLHNPNSNLKRNGAHVRRETKKGLLQIVEPAPPGRVLSAPRVANRRLVILIGASGVAAALLFQSASLYRLFNGWEYNHKLSPCICGPGDEVRIHLPHSVNALKRLWRGHVTAQLEHPEGTPRVPLVASSNNDTWEVELFVTRNEDYSTTFVWVNLTTPNDPKLAGNVGIAHIKLDVTYPTEAGHGRFRNVTAPTLWVIPIRFVPVGAVKTYKRLNLFGACLGTALCVAPLGLVARNEWETRKAIPPAHTQIAAETSPLRPEGSAVDS